MFWKLHFESCKLNPSSPCAPQFLFSKLSFFKHLRPWCNKLQTCMWALDMLPYQVFFKSLKPSVNKAYFTYKTRWIKYADFFFTMPRRKKLPPPPLELQPWPDRPPNGRRPQVETPKRSAIFAVYYWAQQQNIPCNLHSISTVFGIPKSTASDILASGRCRRLQHSDDVDNRPRLRELTRSDTNAIATYLDQAPFEEKSLPWQDVADQAGVAKEFHENQPNTQWSSAVIQRRVTQDESIKTHKAIVKEKHRPAQIQKRLEYCRI